MGEDIEQDKRKAIEIDRAVRTARQRERQKRGCLGCLVLLVGGAILGVVLARCPSKEPQVDRSPLPPIRGVFIAQPLRDGDRAGAATLDGWSAERGADEQISFAIEKGTGRMIQCQYWSTTALNHLTMEHPPQDECSLRGGTDRADGGVEVSFTIIALNVGEGRARSISGTLILSQPVARQFSAILPKP